MKMLSRLILACAGFALLAGCAGAKGGGAAALYPLTEIGTVNGMAAGSDGRMWFTMTKAKAIGAIADGGAVQMFQNPINIDADGERMAAGPDGAMWFTQVNPHAPIDSGPDMIARVTSAGTWAEYPIASWDALPQGIAAGPDGAMWFAERHANAIGRITMHGAIKEHALPNASSGPTFIARGPDGKMWFTETDGDRVGRIDPATGTIVEFTVPSSHAKPGPIVAGPDGALYLIELATSRLARVSVLGRIDERALPRDAGAPLDMAAGPGGQLWIATTRGIEITNAAGARRAFFDESGGEPNAIALGPSSKSVWFAERKGPTSGYTGLAGVGEIDAPLHTP